MAKIKLKPHQVTGGSAYELIKSVERFIYNQQLFDDEAECFDELDLAELALDSIEISPNTALHKIFDHLSYYLFYNPYDDLDWIGSIDDYILFVRDKFHDMGITMPIEFNSDNEEIIYEAKDNYSQTFIAGLKNISNSAFAIAWQQKKFLYDFNFRLSESVSKLKVSDYPVLESDGKIPRVKYFPQWIKGQLKQREKGLCHYCKKLITSPSLAQDEFEIDHMIPLHLGGTNDPTNLVLSCPQCNSSKGATLISVPDIFQWPQRD